MSTSEQDKPKYRQRDLEEQIAEEWAEKTIDQYRQEHKEELDKEFKDLLLFGHSVTHFKTNHLKTESMSDTQTTAAPAKKQVKISEIIELLGKGYTRLAKFDKTGTGSIQAHYNLTASQVKETFDHPKLKGKKTKVQSVEILDDAPGVLPTVIKPKTPKAASAAKVATDADLFK